MQRSCALEHVIYSYAKQITKCVKVINAGNTDAFHPPVDCLYTGKAQVFLNICWF